MHAFTIGLIQMAPTPDVEYNLSHASSMIREAAGSGASLICLPELFLSPYFCQSEDPTFFKLAEAIPGPTTNALGLLAKELKITIIAPVFERQAAGIYFNSSVTITPDGAIAHHYRKMHIPDDPSFYEKFYFTPGDKGFQAHNTQAGRIGTLICWDQWFPEAARLVALQGANVIFYPTAIGWLPNEQEAYGQTQRDAWQTVQRAQAISNGIYVASVNRVGHEKPEPNDDGILFWGSSFICDPNGTVIAEASTDREEILLGTIDLTTIEEFRQNWPFLRDRRIDAYQGLGKRYLD